MAILYFFPFLLVPHAKQMDTLSAAIPGTCIRSHGGAGSTDLVSPQVEVFSVTVTEHQS